jgi:tRNA(Ile)-lysidine synthase
MGVAHRKQGDNRFYCQATESLEEAVQRFVEKEGLLQGVKRLGVALSGGADSVALFHLLLPLCKKNKIELIVLHLDHGLRTDAAQDSKWVKALAKKVGVQCVVERHAVTAHLTEALSVEMAAREVRQAFFEACRTRCKLDAIATGHQADDVAETLMLRLMRGAGATGLAPLKPRSRGFIRPLLHVTGSELRAWLKQQKKSWREDQTNQDVTIPRNRMRHEILPLLEKHFGSGVRSNLCKSAEILREEDSFLEALSQALLSDCLPGDRENALDMKRLLTAPLALQRRVLRLWLWQHELPLCSGFEVIDRVCAMELGDKIQLTENVYVIYQSGVLRILKDFHQQLPETGVKLRGKTRWNKLVFTCSRLKGIESVSQGIGVYPAVCTINPEALNGQPLVVRGRKPGDRMAPYGLKGTKKVQDIFVDAKVPEHCRDGIPLLVCGEEIVWIPGYRIADRFAVSSKTAKSLRIEVVSARLAELEQTEE